MGFFDKKKPLKPFIEQVGPVIHNYWKKKTVFEMKYETSYVASDLGDVKDNYPQKAHADLLPDITETE